MNKRMLWALIILTPLFFLITHAIAYLAHEYSHSFSAWLLGYKQNPLDLNYGTTTLQNILMQSQISEKVVYETFAMAHPWHAALIAFAGIGVGNFALFIISLFLFYRKSLNAIWRYFFLWLIIMNIGNFISYIPIRTFATFGDIYFVESFLNISPWWIMIVPGYAIFCMVWCFYNKILPYAYKALGLSYIFQCALLIIVTFVLFVLFGISGLSGYGEMARYTALLSIYASPMIMAAFWPRRNIETN